MISVEGEVPNGFFVWFQKKYRESKGKEAEMLEKVDIWEVEE